MSRRFVGSLCMITVLLYSAVALSEVVPDTGAVTASTTPEDANVIVEPVSAQGNENWVDMSVTGSYTGSPEHKNTEQIPGIKQYKFVVTCDGVVFKDGKSSLDWQANDTFAFAIKSTSAAKYTVTMVVSVRVAINKKKSDGTAGDFIEWSPVKSVTVTRDVWLVGIKEIKVKPYDAGDDAYIVAPQEVVLLVGAKCMFKAFKEPEDAPCWPTGMPISRLTDEPPFDGVDVNDVTAISPGSVIKSFECGNRKFVTLTVVKPELVSVDFKDGGIQTITDVGTEPEWIKADANGQGARDEPHCAIKNQQFNISVVLSASKNLTFPTTAKMCEGMSTAQVAVNCTFQNWSSVVMLARTAPNRVGLGTYACNWHYTVDNGQNWQQIGESSHVVYTTWETKLCSDADFTKAHIHYACTNANGATTITNTDTGAANKTASAIYGSPGFGNVCDWNAWRFWANNVPGDCGTLASLAGASLKLLGISANAPFFAYPTDDDPVTPSSCQQREEKQLTITHSTSNGSHDVSINAVLIFPENNYEGFFTVSDSGNKAFTVAPPGGPFSTVYYYLEVLRSVTTTQQWVVKGTPGTPSNDSNLPTSAPGPFICPVCNGHIPAGTLIAEGPAVPQMP